MKYFLLLFLCNLYAQETNFILKFAPLPTNSKSQIIEEIVPLFNYIQEISEIKTEFIYEKDYTQIIERFKNDEIDIVILGSLPYLKLRKSTVYAEPIIIFRNNNKKGYYQCVLAKYRKDIIDFNKELKIALTQPLSTCGYYMTNILLKENYSVDLVNEKYDYQMSHSQALISVLDGDFHLAGVKDSIAVDFNSLGIDVIAKSDLVPEFALIVNKKTLSKEQIEKIKNIILNIPESSYQNWKGFLKNGFIEADKSIYNKLQIDFDIIPNVGNIH